MGKFKVNHWLKVEKLWKAVFGKDEADSEAEPIIGKNELFVINLTENADETITADKTFEEILNALIERKTVLGKLFAEVYDEFDFSEDGHITLGKTTCEMQLTGDEYHVLITKKVIEYNEGEWQYGESNTIDLKRAAYTVIS